MKNPISKRLPVLALLLTAGCGGGALGDLGEILTGGPTPEGQARSGEVTVEVQEVRQDRQQIIVRTEDGRQGAVLYDQNTQVIYQDQRYPVDALEYRDVVDMRIQEVQQGYYTDLIQVRTTAQERQGGSGASQETGVHRLEGRIGDIDLDNLLFTLNMTQGGTLPVYLPSNASTAMRDRLRQHRDGDYVKVEVRPIDEQTAELVRWGWDT